MQQAEYWCSIYLKILFAEQMPKAQLIAEIAKS
jgi:hypothetical protein